MLTNKMDNDQTGEFNKTRAWRKGKKMENISEEKV